MIRLRCSGATGRSTRGCRPPPHSFSRGRILAGSRGRILAGVLALALGVSTVLPAPPAAATSSGQGWTLAPSPDGTGRTAFHLTLGPGQSASDRILLANGTAAPLAFRIYAADAVNVAGSGAFALTLPDRPTVGVGKWTTPSVSSLTVPGMQLASIPFTVSVPADAPPGDYAGGVVALDTANQNVGNGQVHINVLNGVGVRIYVHVSGPLHPGLALGPVTVRADVPFLAGITGSSRARIRFRLVNTGNTTIDLTATVTVVDGWGRTVKRFAPRRVPTLLPGSQLSIAEPVWQPLPLAGTQHVQVRVAWAGATLHGQAAFLVVPWALVLGAIVLVVVVLVAVVVLVVRKRRRRAAAAGRVDAVERQAVEPDPTR